MPTAWCVSAPRDHAERSTTTRRIPRAAGRIPLQRVSDDHAFTASCAAAALVVKAGVARIFGVVALAIVAGAHEALVVEPRVGAPFSGLTWRVLSCHARVR